MMKIRRVILPVVLALLMCVVSVPKTHAAGQVVTQETRDWAKKTIENEKTVAVAPTQNAMVILYFLNRTGRAELDPLQKGMTLMLLTDLSQVPNLQFVERIKLQALAEELGLGSSGLVDQTTAPRVGKLVGARFISGGDFVGGKEARFDTQSRLLDVTSSEISAQFSLSGTLDEILATEKELVFKIVDTLKISLKPEEVAAIRKPCSNSVKALDSLFRGVDASDRGEYQQAGELYSEALKIDPDICAAAAALQELIGMGGYSDSMKGKGGKTAKGDIFAPQSALADIAYSVSSQTSLTNQIVHVDVLPKSAIAATTPVRIKVTFP
ncbi:MAG: CsgG/HfaB family protein [Desulfuromonadaceae bacterium]|nr:CsgG/HfaB family protein [Desulfuromonadaceae bacterium]